MQLELATNPSSVTGAISKILEKKKIRRHKMLEISEKKKKRSVTLAGLEEKISQDMEIQ